MAATKSINNLVTQSRSVCNGFIVKNQFFFQKNCFFLLPKPDYYTLASWKIQHEFHVGLQAGLWWQGIAFQSTKMCLLAQLEVHASACVECFLTVQHDSVLYKQVTVQYRQDRGAMLPVRVHTIVVSVQHDEDICLDEMRDALKDKVIKVVVPSVYLDDDTIYHLQPSGRFVIGGPQVVISFACKSSLKVVILESWMHTVTWTLFHWLRVMPAWPVVRSLSIPMEAGEPTVEELSLERTTLKWTAQLRTLPAGWPNL